MNDFANKLCSSHLYSMSDFECLPPWLSRGLEHDLHLNGWLPVQELAIPAILNNHCHKDFLVYAPTGSGKTLAYLLPLLSLLSSRRIILLRAIIILPSKDLLDQVSQLLTRLLGFQDTQVPIRFSSWRDWQENPLPTSTDILLLTPGQAIEFISHDLAPLRSLSFLIMDEIDSLLEINKNTPFLSSLFQFIHSSKSLPWFPTSLSHESCPPPIKLCFSATKTSNPGKLSLLSLSPDPVVISTQEYYEQEEGQKYAVPSTLEEYWTVVPHPREKPTTFLALLRRFSLKTGLIFVQSNRSIETVYSFLREAKKDLPLYCLLPSTPEEHRMVFSHLKDAISRKESCFLICSDAASRGLDIPGLDCVISYDMPLDVKSYIHRAGRTARAGMPGLSFVLVAPSQHTAFKEIISKAIKLERLPWEPLISSLD